MNDMPAEEKSADPSSDRPRHVLLAEDEELVALAMAGELERLGWSVVGPAATLEEAQGLAAGDVPLDAAILDVNLRGRWVHALAEDLRQRGVPFIVCTGYEMVDPDGRFAGAPVIEKPIMIERLGPALDELVDPPGPNRVKVEPPAG